MAKERLGSPRLRLFVALELPPATRDALVAWQRELLALAPEELRPVARDSLHVTLAFLGYRYERDLERIGGAIAQIAGPAVSLAFDRAPQPKPPRRPRLYAAAVVPNEPLLDLRARLVDLLTREASFSDERRAFWPHVTLCRVKSSAKQHRAIEHPPGAPGQLASPAPAARVLLYRSQLSAAGAVYTPLAAVDLSS